MTDVEAVDQLIDLVRANSDIAHVGDGCPADVLEEAERRLGLRLPPSYRRFVGEFGACDVAGVEFLGIFQTPAMGDELLGTVRCEAAIRAWRH